MSNKKMQVNQKTAAKIGLFTAICIVISAVMGIGIFFKNGSVFTNNHNNAYGVLFSWLISAGIALFTAFSFSEIISCKQKNQNTGLAGWTEQFCGYNIGRGIKILQPSFYYIVKVFAMGMFSAGAVFQCYFSVNGWIVKFDGNNTAIFVMLLGLGIIFLFVTLNYISTQFGLYFSKISTIVKFIPIIAIIAIGLFAGLKSGGSGGLWPKSGSEGQEFSFTGMLASIPAILYAFDSFLVIGNISGNIKDSKKNVPLSIIISMSIIAALEILITIAMITAGTGNPYELIVIAFGEGTITADVCVTILSVFILCSVLGVTNSLTLCGMKAMQTAINEKTLIGSYKIKRIAPNNQLIHGVIYFLGVVLIFFLGIFIPSAILNTDQIYDGVSNLTILFFFGLYGFIILSGLVNRYTKKVEVTKFKLYVPCAIVAIIGCFFAVFYTMFYRFFAEIIIDPNNTNALWGLKFMDRTTAMANWQFAIVFWTTGGFFLAWPFMNDLLIKLFNKEYNQSFIWQRTKKLNFTNTIEVA